MKRARRACRHPERVRHVLWAPPSNYALGEAAYWCTACGALNAYDGTRLRWLKPKAARRAGRKT